jgi:hypothetical protein
MNRIFREYPKKTAGTEGRRSLFLKYSLFFCVYAKAAKLLADGVLLLINNQNAKNYSFLKISKIFHAFSRKKERTVS